MLVRSQEFTVALTPPTLTPTLVGPNSHIAFSGDPRLELEPRRRKPLDKEEGPRRLPYAVNEKQQLGAIERSPLHLTVPTLPARPPAGQERVEDHRRLNVEFNWRARHARRNQKVKC